jgi:hypothetical protein
VYSKDDTVRLERYKKVSSDGLDRTNHMREVVQRRETGRTYMQVYYTPPQNSSCQTSVQSNQAE